MCLVQTSFFSHKLIVLDGRKNLSQFSHSVGKYRLVNAVISSIEMTQMFQ